MIEINAVVDAEGLLKRCYISGHAGAGPLGGDIVCAAVSVLARTGAALFSTRPGIRVHTETPKRGIFRMELAYDSAEAPDNREEKNFLSGAGTFLLEGLKSVSQEYPDYCRMTIMEELQWLENAAAVAPKMDGILIPNT